ncbi:MAG: hypothetical protein IPK60_18410 [Sandaracinaceae bacterium]|jgi:hypothetical protein|nr:hypothetical protein [Sandaracinaceae bacterium]
MLRLLTHRAWPLFVVVSLIGCAAGGVPSAVVDLGATDAAALTDLGARDLDVVDLAAADLGSASVDAGDAGLVDFGATDSGSIAVDLGPPSDAGPECTALGCDDDNVCTIDDCDGVGTCVHTPVAAGTTACEDGLACTTTGICTDGVCQGTHYVICTGGCECVEPTGTCGGPACDP